MNTILTGIIAVFSLAWGWDVFVAGLGASGALPWVARQEGMYLSGLLSIALMSFAVLLAARPSWLERPLDGMDRMYLAHKWAGILAVAFAALHWLIEMSGDIIKSQIGREGRPPKIKYEGLLEVLRDFAGEVGEWAIYAVLIMLAITLWKRFPYRRWRFLHQAMPAIYLLLAFHAAMLAPPSYWSRPTGWLLALFLITGTYGSIVALSGRIGRSRQVGGSVVGIEQSAAGVIGVRCRLDRQWPGHRAGQFAFVAFEAGEGAHPFTIASADHGDRTLTFQIKALGDYTASLGQRLRVGQAVTVEGPYGEFDLAQHDSRARQIWIAGGIGVTPFLAWLESLQVSPASAPEAELHYCTRDRESDPFVARLESLCTPLPKVRLIVHGAEQGELLTADKLAAATAKPTEIWFCGPQGLGDALQQGMKALRKGSFTFRREAFAMR